jgi:hypothetical protein
MGAFSGFPPIILGNHPLRSIRQVSFLKENVHFRWFLGVQMVTLYLGLGRRNTPTSEMDGKGDAKLTICGMKLGGHLAAGFGG